MKITLSRRTAVRAISYLAAAFGVAAGIAIQQHAVARDYRSQLENTYTRALGDLSSYLVNISNDLEKGRYVGTSEQFALMAARIWRESGGAKSALSTLPVSDLHMDNTYKFLSQVGDYAMALSKKAAAGGEPGAEEAENAEALRNYAFKLRDYVDDMQRDIREGRITVDALPSGGGDDTEGTRAAHGLSSGFEDIEQTMTGYPTLIYDGPFSDHLLNQRPRMTAALDAVTPEAALEKAALAARVEPAALTRGDDENSNMPLYMFRAGDISVGVTKAGGIPAYLINARSIGAQRMSNHAIFRFAETYLKSLGFENMRATYFETADGICTINYAAVQDDVILYTDLIKVGVALDDGSIVFYDARGYISNHHARALPAPQLTAEQAQQSVNQSLRILSSRLALIPTSGQNEVLTWEFQAQTTDNDDEQPRRLLVYVNAVNGAEEQILILVETPEGTLPPCPPPGRGNRPPLYPQE